jgi:hypothetical protein
MAYSLFLAEALFHISRHTVLFLADFANLADNCLRRECTKCKDLRHLRYLRATHISACINYLSQISLISQIIIASGEGSQRKDLRHLRYLRATHISACINYLSQISQISQIYFRSRKGM